MNRSPAASGKAKGKPLPFCSRSGLGRRSEVGKHHTCPFPLPAFASNGGQAVGGPDAKAVSGT